MSRSLSSPVASARGLTAGRRAIMMSFHVDEIATGHPFEAGSMRISAKADYALRAMAQLASEPRDTAVKAERLASVQGIPLSFLLSILGELKRAHLVRSARGASGGYQLSRAPEEVSLAEILRVVEGPLVNLHDARVRELGHGSASEGLVRVWMAVRTNVRLVLELVTLADLAAGALPPQVEELAGSYRTEPPEVAGRALPS